METCIYLGVGFMSSMLIMLFFMAENFETRMYWHGCVDNYLSPFVLFWFCAPAVNKIYKIAKTCCNYVMTLSVPINMFDISDSIFSRSKKHVE